MNREISAYTPAYEPVNLKEPSALERRVDLVFQDYINEVVKIESDEEMDRRDTVLAEVRKIFLQFVHHIATKVQNLSEEDAEEAVAALFVSGSHRLGVRDVGADIDTVCVAPHFVTRKHFFSYLKEDLLKHSAVTNLNAIEDAFVPLIEFEFRGVAIDLLFAQLADAPISKNFDILDDQILLGVDSSTVTSLNGPRVTNMLFKLVGEKTFPQFLVVLRCIRRWAKKRGLYGNKMGYFGGVNCNILVAFICQLYPNFCPYMLLYRFFKQYQDWKWPEPIMLNNIQRRPVGTLVSSELEVWSADTKVNDIMPLITPAYPAMNSTYNVSIHSFQVIMEEFKRGHEIMTHILEQKRWQSKDSWSKLFEPSEFFLKYPHYLACHIIGTGKNAESQSWIGFVESRMRRLTLPPFLQTLPLKHPIHLHPIVSHTNKSGNSICYFIGFHIDYEQMEKNNLKDLHIDEVIYQFVEGLWDPEKGYKGAKVEGLEFVAEHLPWKKLPKEVFEAYGGFEAAKQKRKDMGFVKPKVVEVVEEPAATAAATDAAGEAATTTETVGATESKEDESSIAVKTEGTEQSNVQETAEGKSGDAVATETAAPAAVVSAPVMETRCAVPTLEQVKKRIMQAATQSNPGPDELTKIAKKKKIVDNSVGLSDLGSEYFVPNVTWQLFG